MSAAESGAAPPGLLSAAQLAEEKRVECRKLKTKLRRWDRDFERERGRRPREEDRAASEEFLGLRSRLQVLDESGDVTNRSNASNSHADTGGGGGSGGALTAAAAAAAAGSGGLFGAALGGLGGASGLEPGYDRLNPGGWWGGGEYYQLVISRVASRYVAHGFDDEPASLLRSAAAMFLQYDMDRDGVIGFQVSEYVSERGSTHESESVGVVRNTAPPASPPRSSDTFTYLLTYHSRSSCSP